MDWQLSSMPEYLDYEPCVEGLRFIHDGLRIVVAELRSPGLFMCTGSVADGSMMKCAGFGLQPGNKAKELTKRGVLIAA